MVLDYDKNLYIKYQRDGSKKRPLVTAAENIRDGVIDLETFMAHFESYLHYEEDVPTEQIHAFAVIRFGAAHEYVMNYREDRPIFKSSQD